MTPLKDSTVFIAGGDTSLGLAIGRRMVSVGVQRIGVIGIDADLAAGNATTLFRSASGIWAVADAGDMSSADDAQRVFTGLSASLGEPDVLVQCSTAGRLLDLVADDMRAAESGTIVTIGEGESDEDGGVRWRYVPAGGDDDAVADTVLIALQRDRAI
ncbi:hypothetical protein ACFULT_07720 [Rhodococcus sp. NPDC057297]|uniref:hypothetical protein n=1 Tax=Rhodococcus sp. NPDC057297 TaxID=3346090 RepID=UPI003636D922